jgi:hypothetical protein|tara:strand:+ start:252 stop:548 length:297 start_codon:yes stop_codon:yes gene_type:complete
MENYIATVKLVGSTDIVELLNFGESPEEIVDNLVLMDNVEFLYHIKREKDNEVWDIDEALEPLRKIRKILDDADSSNINLEILLEEVDAIVEDKNKLN